jgi:hypothetical protein
MFITFFRNENISTCSSEKKLKIEHKNSHKAIKTISPRTENAHAFMLD